MKSVVTIGLGYIGLPTSALIASNGISVFGVDINQDIVDTINRGEIHIVEPELDVVVKSAVDNKLFRAGTKPIESDVYLIVVPTPFKGDRKPDISFVEDATKKIIPMLKENDLFIIESTSPVGTTEKMKDLIYSQRPELINKLLIAYCPERVLPGNILYELVHNDRVIGGIDDKSTKAAIKFYDHFVKGQLHPTNARTAEMCKLTENASRDAQIAFANELSFVCDKAKIDVWELISLANKHPRVNILQPGCGVGGHCIAVDPYFIISDYPKESRLIKGARDINNEKPKWCISKIKETIKDFENKFDSKPTIALCGLSFKPNIDDLRESPAVYIASEVKNFYDNDKLYFIEPNIKNHSDFNLSRLADVKKYIDIFFILVGHKEFKDIYEKGENVLSFVGRR